MNPGTPDGTSASASHLAYQGRSRACAHGVHLECGHVSFASGPVRGRRGRSDVVLCRCACHSECALARRAGTVPVTVWQERCACPGSEQARAAQEPLELLPRFEDWWKTYKSDQQSGWTAHGDITGTSAGSDADH